MRRTTIFIGPLDEQALEVIKAAYGGVNQSQGVRIALRLLAKEITSKWQTTQESQTKSSPTKTADLY